VKAFGESILASSSSGHCFINSKQLKTTKSPVMVSSFKILDKFTSRYKQIFLVSTKLQRYPSKDRIVCFKKQLMKRPRICQRHGEQVKKLELKVRPFP